jgi:hypothetical protein
MVVGINVAADTSMANRPVRAWIVMAVLGAACAALTTACAGTPTGPSVMVLAGAGKTLDEFHRDDGACRQMAAQELQNTKGGEVPAQRRYDMSYMQCMYAKGHQIPVPGTRPSSNVSGSQSAPSASPISGAQIDCERSGGVWRAALNFCEFPKPDTPILR